MKKLALLFLLALLYLGAYAQPILVPENHPTIQAAINAAIDGDTILVAEGHYFENINFKGKAITVASRFIIDQDISHISKTIIDGSQPTNPDSASVVCMSTTKDTTSVLMGFTIQGGTGMGSHTETNYRGGGGIALACGKIESNVIIDNHIIGEGAGGGIVSYPPWITEKNTGSIVIRNNRIEGNTVTAKSRMTGGGAILLGNDGQLILVENNIISGNIVKLTELKYKAVGGGLFIVKDIRSSGKIIIRNNRIFENENHGYVTNGGGIYYVCHSTEGISEDPFYPTQMYNNLIYDNYSENMGGGLCTWYLRDWEHPAPEDPVLYNNTFWGNRAKRGAGIAVIDSKCYLFNNILWDDLTVEGSTEIFDSYFSHCPGWCNHPNVAKITASHNIINGGYPGQGNRDVDPGLSETTYEPEEFSYAIGYGLGKFPLEETWLDAPSSDINGTPRPDPIYTRIDLGAIESPYEGYVYIPDTAFLFALIDQGVDKNADGRISYSESFKTESLNVENYGIADLTGIEEFPNLCFLFCAQNNLTHLDLSRNTKLRFLDCSANLLTSIDLTKNEGLYVGGSCIEAPVPCPNPGIIKLSNMPSLTEVCLPDLFFDSDTTLQVSIDTVSTCLGTGTLDPVDYLKIDTTGSPNVCFDTHCNGECPTVTGFTHNVNSKNLMLYPNPFKDYITIKTDLPGKHTLSITSLNGQRVFYGKMNETPYRIDLSFLHGGLYFIHIFSSDSVITRKIIKL